MEDRNLEQPKTFKKFSLSETIFMLHWASFVLFSFFFMMSIDKKTSQLLIGSFGLLAMFFSFVMADFIGRRRGSE